jgi:cytochrome b
MAVKTVRAWDVPTRVFHWSLVILIIMAPLSANLQDPLMTLHKRVGYAILTLLVWRVLWGFFGGSTSRFKAFFPWPWVVLPYLFGILKGRKAHYLGHNPLGSVMVMLLIAAAAAQGFAGLFTSNDIVTAGPLYPLASKAWNNMMAGYHSYGFVIILSFVAVHVLTNLLYSAFTRDNLIGAMITGTKPEADYVDAKEAKGGPIVLALVLLAVAAGIVLGGIWLVGGDFAAAPAMEF